MLTMKRIICIVISIVLLLALTLGAAGSSSDPLVTRRWLENEYRAALVTELDAAIKKAYDNQLSALSARFGSVPLTAPSGYSASAASVTLAVGQTLNIAQGSSFVLKSGELNVTLRSGVVINLTTGSAMPTTFQAAPNNRYFVAESSQAAVSTSANATITVDGYTKLEGSAATHHPIFKDVAIGAWYYAAVDFAYNNGLFSGTSATEFSPDTAMTRGMFVTVLGRLADIDTSRYTDASQFSDVAGGEYYAPYVAWASSNSVVLGYADGTFRPNKQVTREEMATMMYRFELWRDSNISMTVDPSAAAAFPDFNTVGDWAREPIAWAVANRIINGSDGKLLPQNTATRAQVAQILMNYANR